MNEKPAAEVRAVKLRRRPESVTALEVMAWLKDRNWLGAVRDIDHALDDICGPDRVKK